MILTFKFRKVFIEFSHMQNIFEILFIFIECHRTTFISHVNHFEHCKMVTVEVHIEWVQPVTNWKCSRFILPMMTLWSFIQTLFRIQCIQCAKWLTYIPFMHTKRRIRTPVLFVRSTIVRMLNYLLPNIRKNLKHAVFPCVARHNIHIMEMLSSHWWLLYSHFNTHVSISSSYHACI